MQFKMGKKIVLLHGIKDDSVRELKSAKLNKLREADVQLAMISVNLVDNEEQAHAYSLEVQTKQTEVLQLEISRV